MRIVTRPDFDGIVCSVLLHEVLDVTAPTCWLTAASVQSGEWNASPGDVIANLPYHSQCSLWFDHHASNQHDKPFEGAFSIAPSAARVIFEYYKEQLSPRFTELVEAADRVDSADLTMGEILDLGSNPYFLLSITLEGSYYRSEDYWIWIVDMLRTRPIQSIIAEPEVEERCLAVFNDHDAFKKALVDNTTMNGDVSVTDFRGLPKVTSGNRFLVYCLFPDCITNVKISDNVANPEITRCSVGHNIFKRDAKVSVGELLKDYNGGGHFGAGGASLSTQRADRDVAEIVEILNKNIPLHGKQP